MTSFKGNLDNPFAFPAVGSSWAKHSMLYVYADKINVQHCSRAAASVGIPRIVVSGLWSVVKMNLHATTL